MPGPCTPYLTPDEVTYCDASEEVLEELIDLASEVMYGLLGGQFHGTCTATVRPCRDAWDCGCWSPVVCDCHADALVLPPTTIAVTSINIGGVVLDPADYRLAGNVVHRLDGLDWPYANSLTAASGDPGVWEVTYTFGRPPDRLVKAATAEYVVELYKEMTADPSRKLPSGATGLSRQGVSISLQDRVEQARKAGPTFPMMNVALARYNPANVRVPAEVLNPDTGWVLHGI